MARGETMGKWLSINEISKTLDIPGTTVRRYRNKFPEYIENKGTTLDGVRKYPESILRVVKQIYGLYQDGKRTSEIKAILSKEHEAVIQMQEQQEIIYQTFSVSAMNEIIQQNTKAMQEVAAALHDMKNLQTRIESQEQEMAFLRQELQELRTVSRPEKNKWYKRIFGK